MDFNEIDVDLDVDLELGIDSIMHEIDELDVSVFNSQTSQTLEQETISPPRTRLRSRDEGGPSTRTRSATSSLSCSNF